MDIIDVMLAKAMTPQGKTDAYVAKANRAAQKAAQAEADAAAAVAAVAEAAEDIADKKDAADALLAEAQEVLETAQQAQINMPEAYVTTGQNTDGYMTQKAVTDMLSIKANAAEVNSALAQKADASALAEKADAATTASKAYVDEAISHIQIPEVDIDLDENNAGHLVKVNNEGTIAASAITESMIADLLLKTGIYAGDNVVGLDINYGTGQTARLQESENLNMGSDFDQYIMYGGRVRCNVADDGTINAFYGEQGYMDDGSNGQVMIYQPKFYYKRMIQSADRLSKGKIVRHEVLLLSAEEQAGFKLAPVFNGGLEYILLPAYDAGLVNDKLTSIGGVLPITNITISEAEQYAKNRGAGWHIMNMAAESANQMLEIVEFGTMNGQDALELGICISAGTNALCYTGSTASLGNGTGHANATNIDVNGNVTEFTNDGDRAISYRGMENPWGHLWSMIGGVNVVGNATQEGGSIYICDDFNYTPQAVGNNYHDIGFNLPNRFGWISAMGYGKEEYDWVYMPIECAETATSLSPVGDSLWTEPGLIGVRHVATGGSFGFRDECGPFYYAADRNVEDTPRKNYGAKLLFIPQKNNIYLSNITKWQNYIGG